MTVDDDGVHLDEGTIHAWLDGELDAEQSARLNAHIGRCGACAAHVAEARGLIAGASRVIGMLDEHPTPMVRPAVTPTAGTDMSAWRLLRVTPARASIAAMLVVAVGIMLTRGQAAREPASATRARDAAAPVAEPVASASANAPVKSDSVLSSAIERRLAAEQPPRTMERAPGVAVPSAPVTAPAPNADLADASSKVVAGRENLAAGRVIAAPGADRTRAGVGQQVLRDAMTTAGTVSAAKAADAASAGSVAAQYSARAASNGAIVARECYRVESTSPAVWGSVRLPMIVAMDSTGQEGRVLTPSGDDTEARAYLQYNGADSAFFRLRRIGYDGTMTLLSATGTRTGTLTSSSVQRVAAKAAAAPLRRAAEATAPASGAGATQTSITARVVACPQAP